MGAARMGSAPAGETAPGTPRELGPGLGAPARRRLRRGAALAAVLPLALVAGCSGVQNGSAALVGTNAISESSLQSRVQSFLDSLPSTQRATARGNLATIQASVLNEMVIESVAGEVADTVGVAVTPAQLSTAVQSTVTGAGSALDADLAQYNLTRATLPGVVQVSLQYVLIGERLGGSTQTQQQAGARGAQYVAAASRQLPVKVSPRYGSWNDASLTLAGGPQSISTPAPTAAAVS